MQDSGHKILNFILCGDKNDRFKRQNKITFYPIETSIKEYATIEWGMDRHAFFHYDYLPDCCTSN